MILPDANTLLNAVNRSSDQHARTTHRASVLHGRCCWLSSLECAQGIFPRPLSIDDALSVIEWWLANSRTQVVHPGERRTQIIGRKSVGTAGNLTTDAHLAALAIEHGATVLGFDRDFARFEGVHWSLPSAD